MRKELSARTEDPRLRFIVLSPGFEHSRHSRTSGTRSASGLATRNAQLGLFHDHEMKAIFALISLLLPLALAQIDTECNNFACNAVEQSASTCESQESTDQGYANCLCNDVLALTHLIFCKLTHRECRSSG